MFLKEQTCKSVFPGFIYATTGKHVKTLPGTAVVLPKSEFFLVTHRALGVMCINGGTDHFEKCKAGIKILKLHLVNFKGFFLSGVEFQILPC